MRAAISVRELGKRYRLGGEPQGSYRTFREVVTRTAMAPLRRLRGQSAQKTNDVWALEGVSFDVQPGEVLGVIGRNGAGKSTLLKVLSRIVAPTQGEVSLRGRVGSLLEVGTGFHPELTGRDNIFLNGAILGMTRKEIQRKFDDIVAFSEVEKFLDTPVKRYSSGMYMKLAFAVASHLEPEILLVDEVLAVGDTQFQKKCLGKMGEVSKAGRTVLFVSHNMAAVKSLCTRAILIEAGKIAADGDLDKVVDRYLSGGTDMAKTGVIPEDAPRFQDVRGEAMFRSVALTDQAGHPTDQLYFCQPFRVNVVCDLLKDIPDGHFEVSISTQDGTQVTSSTTMDEARGPMFFAKGRHEFSVDFDNALLPRGYTVDVGMHHSNGATSDLVCRTLDFDVLRVAETGDDHYPWPRSRGFVRVPGKWKLKTQSG